MKTLLQPRHLKLAEFMIMREGGNDGNEGAIT